MIVHGALALPAPSRYKHDTRVYVLVEEARLRCEALCAAAPTDERRGELRRLHRNLGLSGLYASTNIPASVRRALLARVHGRCEALGGGGATMRGLTRTVRRAAKALARALVKDGPADHRELAQLHLDRAMEFLLPAPSPRPSVRHVFRQRHRARRASSRANLGRT
jgi:hypothetical protein